MSAYSALLMTTVVIALFALLLSSSTVNVSAAATTMLSMPPRDKYPQIISHRGASGYIPEHSLAAYRAAMDMSTDYIEPDLCISLDGVFVALHDLLLDDTTNVASFSEYASRKRTQVVDGKTLTGFFVNDFTVAELKTLRLNQRLSQRSQLYNGLLQIPTFDEIIALIHTQYNNTGITFGMYPELKHPSYFNSLGYSMEDMLLNQLSANGYIVRGPDTPNNLKQVVPVVIQCFEANTLITLRSKSDLPLILLIDKPNTNIRSYWNVEGLKNISTFANGVGPEKSFFENDSVQVARQDVNMAHNANLYIHPWTFRADSDIGLKFNGSFDDEELFFFCCLGMDGVFTEFPDRTREAIDFYSNLTVPADVNDRSACGKLQCS